MEDRLISNNTFAWDNVVLNFIGTKEYDYQWSWVLRKRVDGLLSKYLFIYVDNRRPIGTTEILCRVSSRRWGLTCSWLGI